MITDEEAIAIGAAHCEAQRAKWNVEPGKQPIASAGGACAWGHPVNDEERAASRAS